MHKSISSQFTEKFRNLHDKRNFSNYLMNDFAALSLFDFLVQPRTEQASIN